MLFPIFFGVMNFTYRGFLHIAPLIFNRHEMLYQFKHFIQHIHVTQDSETCLSALLCIYFTFGRHYTHTVYNLNTPIYTTLTPFRILLAVGQTPTHRGHAWHQQMR